MSCVIIAFLLFGHFGLGNNGFGICIHFLAGVSAKGFVLLLHSPFVPLRVDNNAFGLPEFLALGLAKLIWAKLYNTVNSVASFTAAWSQKSFC